MSNNDIAVLANEYILSGLKGGIILTPKQAFKMARDFYSEVAVRPRCEDMPDTLRKEMESLIADGRPIQAIKQYRISTGATLKDAKDVVDAMRGL